MLNSVKKSWMLRYCFCEISQLICRLLHCGAFHPGLNVFLLHASLISQQDAGSRRCKGGLCASEHVSWLEQRMTRRSFAAKLWSSCCDSQCGLTFPVLLGDRDFVSSRLQVVGFDHAHFLLEHLQHTQSLMSHMRCWCTHLIYQDYRTSKTFYCLEKR